MPNELISPFSLCTVQSSVHVVINWYGALLIATSGNEDIVLALQQRKGLVQHGMGGSFSSPITKQMLSDVAKPCYASKETRETTQEDKKAAFKYNTIESVSTVDFGPHIEKLNRVHEVP